VSIDISRKRFQPRKNYGGVVMQQGRVQLDADWNENVAIRDRRDRSETYDTFGTCIYPETTPDAFKIEASGGTLEIGPGRMYVDGLQAENHGLDPLEWDPHLAEQRGSAPVPYGEQPYLPEADTEAPLPATPGTHLVYLDVWQREVNQLIDPDLVEIAVGVDTTARLQTVWQVKVLADVGDINCATPPEDIPGWLAETAPSAGRLTTGPLTIPADPDPCLLPPTSGYRGLENHTYRVEIHDPGVPLEPGDASDPPPPGTATFKWSRDNGTVAAAVTALPALDRVKVDSLGRDEFLRFRDGDWVEVTDRLRELYGLPGFLSKITVDEDNSELLLDTPLPAATFPTDPTDDTTLPGRHTRVRRWDQSGLVEDTSGNDIVDLNGAGASGAIPVPPPGTPIELEAGVLVTFETPSGGAMRSGDAWIFVARTADGSVEELTEEPPYAIHHHYCRLALLHQPEDGEPEVTDCRHPWGCGCCEISVAPGQDVQAAIDAIPAEGGRVCLQVGVHRIRQPLLIEGRRNLVLAGCGPGSKLVLDADAEVSFEAAVHVGGDSHNIGVEDLSIYSDRCARLIAAHEVVEVAVKRAVLVNASQGDLADAILLGDCRGVRIEECKLLARRGVVQADAEALVALLTELGALAPPEGDQPDDSVAVGIADVPPTALQPPVVETIETIEDLRVGDNLIFATQRGILLQDVHLGDIVDNRIAPADDRFDGFERPEEPVVIESDGVSDEAAAPEPAGPLDEFFDSLHETFDVLVPTPVDADGLDDLDIGIEACLLDTIAIEDNEIQAATGCRLHYSRRVTARRNHLRARVVGIVTSYAFDFTVRRNRIEVLPHDEKPKEEEPAIKLSNLGLWSPGATAVALDFARGVRIGRNDLHAPSGIVAQRRTRSACPAESAFSLIRVLGISKAWRVVVELLWILFNFARLLDPPQNEEEPPTKAEFEIKLLARWSALVAGLHLPAFLGKALMEENRLCVERFGILARQVFTLGGIRVVANRVTGARYTGIEIIPLFSIGLVERFSRWIGCALDFLVALVRLFYQALTRFIDGEPMPDPQPGTGGATQIGVTLVSGFMSLCRRLCGEPPDGGGSDDGGDHPTPDDLRDALGDLLDGLCWIDDLIDGAYRISRNTVRGGGTGIWAGIDGTRVDDNKVEVDPDDPVAWEAVILGLSMAQGANPDPATSAVAQALMDLDRDLLLFALFNNDAPPKAPPGLAGFIAGYSAAVAPDSPLRPWVDKLASAAATGADVDAAWVALLATIWANLRGYGIVLVGGNHLCTGNRVVANERCFAVARGNVIGGQDLRVGKPPAVGGIWHFTNIAGLLMDIARVALQEGTNNTKVVQYVYGLILWMALASEKGRDMEVCDCHVRRALVHGIYLRSVTGLGLVDINDNHVRDAGCCGVLFGGGEAKVRVHHNAVIRSEDVYGFLERPRPPDFARLIEIVAADTADQSTGLRGDSLVLVSDNHGDGQLLSGGEGSSAVLVRAGSVGVSDNHTSTDANFAIRVEAVTGLFTDNLSNRANVVPASIEQPPNPTNI